MSSTATAPPPPRSEALDIASPRPNAPPVTTAPSNLRLPSALLPLPRLPTPRPPHSRRSTCRSATRPAPCRPCRRCPLERAARAACGGHRHGRSRAGMPRRRRRVARAGTRASVPTTCVFVSSLGSRTTFGTRRPSWRQDLLSRSSWPSGWPTFTITVAARIQPLVRQLEELPRREVERDVGLAVHVDHDRVVPRRCGAGTAARPRGARACGGCAGRTTAARASVARRRSRRRPPWWRGSSGPARAPSCRRRCPGSPPRAAARARGERQHEELVPVVAGQVRARAGTCECTA